MKQALYTRTDTQTDPKTKLATTITTLMVRNSAGRHLAVWSGTDPKDFPRSSSGLAWAAGEPLPLKVEGRSPEVLAKATEARRRKGHSSRSEER